MKNIPYLLLVALAFIFMVPAFTACKKGDGDPTLSIYSRKHRLCIDWKVSNLKKTVQYRNTTITTTFTGEKKTVETHVIDTVVYTVDDTLFEYRNTKTYTGSLLYSFDKSGTYQIDEAFTDDTTQVKYTSVETGYWYFTGGNENSGTKYKELLGLQPDKYVYNPLSPDTYTFQYSGQNVMYVFHIYKLASKEMELRANTEEATNLYRITTDLTMVLKPR